jgi:hypothetical protein
MDKYRGVVVEESLEDNRIMNGLEVVGIHISGQENPSERWHLYTIRVNEEEIERLSSSIKNAWYMHFWIGRKVIVIFNNRRFDFDYDTKATWRPAVEYGLSVGIPESQLDFKID